MQPTPPPMTVDELITIARENERVAILLAFCRELTKDGDPIQAREAVRAVMAITGRDISTADALAVANTLP